MDKYKEKAIKQKIKKEVTRGMEIEEIEINELNSEGELDIYVEINIGGKSICEIYQSNEKDINYEDMGQYIKDSEKIAREVFNKDSEYNTNDNLESLIEKNIQFKRGMKKVKTIETAELRAGIKDLIKSGLSYDEIYKKAEEKYL